MKIFVTGHKGYIGTHVVGVLKQAGHTVTGCDLGLFDGCEWDRIVAPDRELIQDVRDVSEQQLDGHDAICHLAAISNDPMGELDPNVTSSINRDGSVNLARRAKAAGVRRFLFSGSCAVYGKAERLDLTEDDPLNPCTAYAKSKIEAEQAISRLADDGFTPVFLRSATAYGTSPMLRIDLVVNNLLASALAYNEIRILSDGSPWRPLIHCRDIARAFAAFLDAPRQRIHNLAVNVGADDQNFQVRDGADAINRLLPDASITYRGDARPDARDYRVSFARLASILPDFKLEYTMTAGLEELHADMIDHGFSRPDFEGDRFVRLRSLRRRLDRLAIAAPTA